MPVVKQLLWYKETNMPTLLPSAAQRACGKVLAHACFMTSISLGKETSK